MLLAAAEKWNIDLSNSVMVGDTESDTLAGSAAGCKTIILDRVYNQGVPADMRVADLEGIINIIKKFN